MLRATSCPDDSGPTLPGNHQGDRLTAGLCLFRSPSGGNFFRSPSGSSFFVKSPSGNNLLSLSAIHQEARWEDEGGWRACSDERQVQHRMERDASMVRLLNLLDPASLVDQAASSPKNAAGAKRHQSASSLQAGPQLLRSNSNHEQHSALSQRGVAFVGATSAFMWYLLRLAMRDGLISVKTMQKQVALELHSLSAIHSLGWIVFLVSKLRQPREELPKYCSRALVASLGFYLHDCWMLKSTLLRSPGTLAHQFSLAVTIMSILRSKGVAWLAPALMSLSLPTLAQEILQLCGPLGIPASRPEVRGLRLIWFISFCASKLALVPLWLRHSQLPELHQPSLLPGKVSYMVSLFLNLHFMVSAVRDLPNYLRPTGAVVCAARAYQRPIKGGLAAMNALVSAAVLGTILGSYAAGPAAAILGFLALTSRNCRAVQTSAGLCCAAIALDRVLPIPHECSSGARVLLPLMRAVKAAFHHRVYPSSEMALRQDRNYLFALTPHGFFPWGPAVFLVELFLQGYLPNLLGASVLGSLPVAGRLLRTFGYRPATASEVRRCLQKPYPRNVTVIIPGGIREMFCVRQDIEISVANTRKGFVELACESGAMLVPGYCFGSTQLYKVAEGWLGKLFEAISRRLKASVTLFHGSFFLLPYAHDLGTALGKPIDTRIVSNAQEAQQLWIQRLREAFEQHKADFGWPNRNLYFDGEDVPPLPQDPLESYTALPSLSKL